MAVFLWVTEMADNLLSRVEILIDANTARFESGIARAEKVADQSSKNMTNGFGRMTVGAKQTETQIDKFSSSLIKHEVEIKKVANSYNLLGKVGASVAGILSVSKVIDVADGYGQMAAQIQNATKDQREYNLVQKHLLETANTTYRNLKEAQQVYLDVGGALQAYGASTERALRITDSLSFSFTHNATAADKAASATDAFMKSIYSGNVSGEQWISIISAIPSVVNDLSDSLGKSKDVILAMGNAGELTSKQLNDAFDKSREKSEALANAMRNSLADGKVALANSFEKVIGEANIAYDATHRLAGGLSFVADNLETLVEVGSVAVAFWAGTYLPVLGSSTLAGYAKAKQLVEQTAVQYAAIQAERVAATTELAGAQAQVANTQSTLAALQAERALELQRMKNQISAQGLAASHTRLAQVGVIEAQVKKKIMHFSN